MRWLHRRPTSWRPSRRRMPVSSLSRQVESLERRMVLSTLPPGFSETVVTSDLADSVQMEFAPDGRIFVTQKGGEVRIVNPDGQVDPTPFVTLPVDSRGEAGMLGVTLDPDFESNGFVYLYYTVPGAAPHNRVSRFTADGNTAVPGSERILLDIEPLSGSFNHNGGAIHFGPDGKLYIGVGENTRRDESQSLDSLLGKILRINRDGSIPTDNPFFNTATGENRAIWALGLRNPFTFNFQPGTGRLFINDVGAASWEEINNGVAGGNYGWPATEGPTNDPRFITPLFAYQHGDTTETGCAIIGSAFYNPEVSQFPDAFIGDYLFADLCNGWVRRYDPVTDTAHDFITDINAAVDIDVAPDGSVFLLTRGSAGDAIVKIEFPAGQPGPTIGVTNTSPVYTEGAAAIRIEPQATLSDPDSQNFAGGVLSVAFTQDIVTNAILGISHQGTGAGQIGVSGNNVSFSGQVIGTFTGGTPGGPLTLQLNSRATVPATQALLRRISFIDPGDNPLPGTHPVVFQLTEASGATSNAALKTIVVVAVNDAPRIRFSDGAVSYHSGDSPVLIDALAQVTDPDSTNFAGGKLTVSIANAQATDKLALRQTPGPGGVLVNGTTVSVGGVVVGTINSSPSSFTITFNGQTTPSRARTVLRNVTFETASGSTTPRNIRATLSDGDGGLSPVASKTVNVTAESTAAVRLLTGRLEINANGANAQILVTQLPNGNLAVVGVGTTLTADSAGLVQVSPNIVTTEVPSITARDLTIRTGEGDDLVVIVDYRTALRLLGRPSIGVRLFPVRLDDVSISTGAGTDRVVLSRVQIAGTDNFDLGGQPGDRLEILNPPLLQVARPAELSALGGLLEDPLGRKARLGF